MNVTRASVVREPARISIEGLAPISSPPRDVYLYVQTFNMPKIATGGDRERLRKTFDVTRARGIVEGQGSGYEIEDLAALYPTYIVHVYHDTGKKMKLEKGGEAPIMRPQTAFGYFALHEGNLYGWETRLYGAEKIADNFYHLQISNNGAANVETGIQARESANEPPLPPDGNVGCCNALAAWLDTKGPIGKLAAQIVRLVCKLLGQPTT